MSQRHWAPELGLLQMLLLRLSMPALVCQICAYLVTKKVFIEHDIEMMDSEEKCFS
jgi:hypothetical protein